jgi:hypothetical protein
MNASRGGRMLGSLRARLTFANVMASVAVFIALGGASYAAVSIPKNSVGSKQLRAHSVKPGDLANGSVGTKQLRRRSVTAAKVANKGVTKRSLSSWIRSQLRRRAATGPQGPAGPTGPRGPGAVPVRYSANAGATPAFKTAFDVGGFSIRGSCNTTANGTLLNVVLRSAQGATVYQTIAIDQGPVPPPTDPFPPNQGDADVANQQITLAAGTPLNPGGPEANDGYIRIAVNGVYASGNNTLDYHFVLVVTDPAGSAPGRCTINGVIVPA